MGGNIAIEPMEITTGTVHHIEHDAQGSGLATSIGSQYTIYVPFFYSKGKVFYGGKKTEFFGKVVYGEYLFQSVTGLWPIPNMTTNR